MFLLLKHTQLDIYKISRELIFVCYHQTSSFPKEERFALTQQIRRAAVSIHLNIAEGCSRISLTERNRFFEISRGSVIELDAALDIAVSLGFTTNENLQQMGQLIQRAFQILSKMMQKPES